MKPEVTFWDGDPATIQTVPGSFTSRSKARVDYHRARSYPVAVAVVTDSLMQAVGNLSRPEI